MRADGNDGVSAKLDVAELMRLTKEMAKGVRLSGSDDEKRAFDFAEEYLADAGLKTERLSTDAMIGYPLEASLEVLEPESLQFEAWGNNLAPSTPPGGIEAELVQASRAEGIAGQIVLLDHAANIPAQGRPLALVRADIDPLRLHQRGDSPIWGNPTPRTLALLPQIPSIGVSGADGARLSRLVARGPVRVRLKARMYRDWTRIPLLTAEVPGSDEADFSLFSAHIDSWYFGAMDNAAANAVQLHLARLLHENRSRLRRGVRIAFWSGHSHGKFAGSASYADAHWQELYDRCVCHVYIDSPGAKGATVLGDCQTMSETYGFTASVIKKVTGQSLRYFRIAKAGDQSFWGIGVPSTLVLPSLVPVASGESVPQVGASAANQGGLPWFWHTPDDTIDKIDPNNLLRDATVYSELLWQLSTAAALPFDYRPTAQEMATALVQYQDAFEGTLDLREAIGAAEGFGEAIRRWEDSGCGPTERNRVLKSLGRALVPAAFTQTGPFDHDTGSLTGPFPGIEAGLPMLRLPVSSDDRRALVVQTSRQANRALAALTSATRIVS